MGKIITPDNARNFMEDNELTLSQADRAKLDAALKDGWRLTPATMAVRLTNGWWIPAKHLLHLSTIVASEINKGGARILVSMPFRHGKSEFLSINTSIWFLEHWANKFVMNLTYGKELVTDFSTRVRDTFQNQDLHHLLRTRLNPKKTRAERFITTDGGGLTAAGVGGPIIGRGADLMLIDDYVKNAEEAMSETYHSKIWEWFRGVAYTRLEPGASLIVLATRWAQNDLIGRLQTEMPEENWVIVNLPMHAVVNDPIGREVGEVLWPERYDEKACARIQKALGPFWYAAQCQGNPPASMSGADAGDKIKTIKHSELPSYVDMQWIRAWDLAASPERDGDYTAGPKIGLHKPSGKIYLGDLVRGQYTPGKNKLIIKETTILDGHGVKVWMEQEPGSAGKTVIYDYQKLLKGYNFEGEKATGPPEVRASPLFAAIEAGKVIMVEDDWNEDVRHEFNTFPDGDHDDIVISMSLGYNKLVHGLSSQLTWGRESFEEVENKVIQFPHGKVRRPVSEQEIHDTPRRGLVW